MTLPSRKPVFLNLFQIRLPLPGVLSIIHRASGLLLFLLIFPAIGLFQQSLQSDEGFQFVIQLMEHPLALIIRIFIFWQILHHLLAGIRYLLMDVDIGVDHDQYRKGAWVVMLLAPVLAIMLELSI